MYVYIISEVYIFLTVFDIYIYISKTVKKIYTSEISPGRVAQWVARLTQEPEVPGSIPGLATYFRFSFR